MEEIQKIAIVLNTLLLKVLELFEKWNKRSEKHAGGIRTKQFGDLNKSIKQEELIDDCAESNTGMNSTSEISEN